MSTFLHKISPDRLLAYEDKPGYTDDAIKLGSFGLFLVGCLIPTVLPVVLGGFFLTQLPAEREFSDRDRLYGQIGQNLIYFGFGTASTLFLGGAVAIGAKKFNENHLSTKESIQIVESDPYGYVDGIQPSTESSGESQ